MILVFFFCLIGFLPQSNSDDTKFYIERVEVFSSYNSILVLKLSNTIVPPDKLVDKSDVSCLVNQVKATGLFGDVKAQLVTSGEGMRQLILTCIPRAHLPKFVVTDIILDGLPEIDQTKFLASLNEKGVKAGMPLLRHTYQALNNKVDESLRDALPSNLLDQYQGSAWVTIRPTGPRKVRLIVSPEFEDCKASSNIGARSEPSSHLELREYLP